MFQKRYTETWGQCNASETSSFVKTGDNDAILSEVCVNIIFIYLIHSLIFTYLIN